MKKSFQFSGNSANEHKNPVSVTKEIFFVFAGIFLILSTTHLFAQQSVNSGGGEAKGSGGSASYSVGQVFYQTTSDDGGTVSEGVQQPYEIFIVTSVEEFPEINLIFAAYPNPVRDNLLLIVSNDIDFSGAAVTYHLLDAAGKVIEFERVTSRHTRIDMNNLPRAVYFLRVTENRKEFKTFKIIKN